jgi:serine phosphatase RsbU (regulator of sigma subunit)
LPYLTITAADGRTFQRPLDKDVITVGRSSKNDVNLSFDLSLSRFHAEIVRDGDRFVVRDVGSRNGTSVNGMPVVQPVPLRIGDKITLGETTITFGEERPPQVVLDDAPVSKDTTTFSIPLDDIITRSRPGPSRSGTEPALVKDLGATLAPVAAGAEGRTLALLNRAGMELITHREGEEILNVIMDLVFEAIPAERGFLMLLEGEGKEMVSKTVRDLTRSSGGAISLSRSIANMVIRNRQSILTQDAQADERFRMRESVVLQGIRSAMCVPLWNNKEVIGLIYVDTVNQGVAFRPEDLKLLTLLANIAAVKIENARLVEESIKKEAIEKELEQAADIQKRLLPGDPPDVPGYEFRGHTEACRAVGGDYFDFVRRGEAKVGIAIGDVSGKGMAAALLMANVQAVFRTLADVEADPAGLTAALNRHLIRSANPNKFVSFFFGELEAAGGLLRYVNAGHNPPYLIRAGGEVESLAASGIVLGVFPEAAFAEQRVSIRPGDVLALFSDGVTEAQNPEGEMWGEDRLVEILKEKRALPAAEIDEAIHESLRRFSTGAPQYDDATLVILKRTA